MIRSVTASFLTPASAHFELADARAIRETISRALERPPLCLAPHVVDDPDAWVLDALRQPPWLQGALDDPEAPRHEPWIIADSTTEGLVSLHIDRPGAYLWISVSFPHTAEYSIRQPRLVRELGPLAKAVWGVSTPFEAAVAIHEGAGRDRPRFAEPAPVEALLNPPPLLGWTCYWSPAACATLGFSLDDPRSALFAYAEPAPPGVFLQLTEAPLDLARSEHLAALTAAYIAFPGL